VQKVELTGLQSLGSKSISLLQRGSEGLQNIMEAGKAIRLVWLD
jgi:hypothetical protein